MASGNYVSKSKLLYKRVFVGVIGFAFLIVVYAVFFMNQKVTVSFNNNVSTMANYPPIKVNKGEAIGPELFLDIQNYLRGNEKDGYFFDAWYAGDVPLGAATVFEQDTTINANWVPYQFTVEYILNAGETYDGEEPLQEVVEFDSNFTLPLANGFLKTVSGGEPQVLKEWTTIGGTQTLTYPPGTTAKLGHIKMFELKSSEGAPDTSGYPDDLIMGKLKLRPSWKDQEVVLTFVVGEGEVITVNVGKGKKLDEGDVPNPLSDTHTLEGWYYDEECELPVNWSEHRFNENTTLYSKWSARYYSIEFNSMSGSAVATQQVQFGEVLNNPTPPARTNYGFIGWYVMNNNIPPALLSTLDEAGNQTYDYSSGTLYDFDAPVEREFVLYARWELQWNFDNGVTPIMHFSYETSTDGTGLRIKGVLNPIKDREVIWVPQFYNGPSGPEYIVEIYSNAFNNMPNLKTIYISEYVKVISPTAFGEGLPNLTTFKVWYNNPNYADMDGVLYTKDMKTLIKYPSGRPDTTYEIGNINRPVLNVNESAFSYANNLIKVIINADNIASRAFNSCINLEEVVIGPTVKSIGAEVFSNCQKVNKITVQEGNTIYAVDNTGFALYSNNFTNLIYFLPTFTGGTYYVHDNTRVIGSRAFVNVDGLAVVYFKNVETISYNAFNNNKNLNTLNFTNALSRIEVGAFRGSTALTTVTIPESLTSLGEGDGNDYIFKNCINLLTIKIKAGSAADAYFSNADIENATIVRT